MSQRQIRLRDLHREAAAARALHELVFGTFGHCSAAELAAKVTHAIKNIKFDDPRPEVHLDSQFLALRGLLTRSEWDLLPFTAHQMRDGIEPRFPSDERRIKRIAQERHRRHRLQKERELQVAQALERERLSVLERLRDIRQRQASLGQLRELRDEHSRRLRERIISELNVDFLGIDRHVATHWRPGSPCRTFFEKLKARFVQNWANQHLGLDLDEEQAAAVGAVAGNVLVTARAGSGKTRVLTARAIFLQEHCRVPSHQIMLLAFNRAAAAEMEKRLRDRLGENIPHVMTFHALAHALVHPSEKLLFDDKDDGQLHLTEEVQRIIDEFVRDDEWQGRIRDLLLEHFEADWSRIESGGYHLTGDEFVRFRHSLTQETLNGERVRSFGQKVIANALVEHGIEYRFDHAFNWSGRRLRADFLVRGTQETRVYVRYVEEAKKRTGMDDEWVLLEGAVKNGKLKGKLLKFTREDMQRLGEEQFVPHLCARLRDLGLSPNRLSRDELWQRIKDRVIGEFSKAMEQFVGRCRQRNWSPQELDIEIITHEAIPGASNAELEFYRIGSAVYNAYLGHLERHGREDFNGLMLRAADTVDGGILHFARKGNSGSVLSLRYLHVDEYQDFSRSFHNLTQAMRRRNPKLEVFCVGDDWQAINGFAGSDLQYFKNFGAHFSPATPRAISRNYRSARRIVETSNLVLGMEDIKARPVHEREGYVYVCDLESFRPLPVERRGREDSGFVTTKEGYEFAIGRLVHHAAKQGSVVLLNRTNNPDVMPGSKLHTALKMLRETLPRHLRERVSISTAHGYKGLEQDTVIILDAVANHYPLVHPHWTFGRIFGDSLESIERDELRLFYVALTRAKKGLFVCTQASKVSPFLAAIEGNPAVHRLAWRSLAPVPHEGPELCEARIYYSYEVRELLEADGFEFEDAEAWRDKHWRKVLRRSEVTQAWIRDAPWNVGRVVIKIIDKAGNVVWSSETDDLADWTVQRTAGSEL